MAFDFSKLPETRTNRTSEPELVGTIVDLVNSAPRALSLAEIMQVLTDSGIETPADSTVRNHLNRAVRTGRIAKPTRQSYGPATEADEGADEGADAADDGADEDDEDALADL